MGSRQTMPRSNTNVLPKASIDPLRLSQDDRVVTSTEAAMDYRSRWEECVEGEDDRCLFEAMASVCECVRDLQEKKAAGEAIAIKKAEYRLKRAKNELAKLLSTPLYKSLRLQKLSNIQIAELYSRCRITDRMWMQAEAQSLEKLWEFIFGLNEAGESNLIDFDPARLKKSGKDECFVSLFCRYLNGKVKNWQLDEYRKLKRKSGEPYKDKDGKTQYKYTQQLPEDLDRYDTYNPNDDREYLETTFHGEIRELAAKIGDIAHPKYPRLTLRLVVDRLFYADLPSNNYQIETSLKLPSKTVKRFWKKYCLPAFLEALSD